MFCPQCGSNQSDDLKFCKSCGVNLEAVRQAAAMRHDAGKFDWNRTWVAEMFFSDSERRRRKEEFERERGITPAMKRYTEIKAGVITSSVGVAVMIFLNFLMKGIILSGHGRVQAAKALDLPTIPTRVIAGLSEAKKRAYVIADNKLAQLAGWDGTLLKDELELLIAENFDIETTGFSTAEIDILFDGAEEPSGSDPDDLQPDDIAAEVVSNADL